MTMNQVEKRNYIHAMLFATCGAYKFSGVRICQRAFCEIVGCSPRVLTEIAASARKGLPYASRRKRPSSSCHQSQEMSIVLPVLQSYMKRHGLPSPTGRG